MTRLVFSKLLMMGFISIIFFAGCSVPLEKADITRCVSMMNNAQRDRCLLDMAERQKDLSFCEKIGDVDVRNFCLQK